VKKEDLINLLKRCPEDFDVVFMGREGRTPVKGVVVVDNSTKVFTADRRESKDTATQMIVLSGRTDEEEGRDS
jgi:hypothetical protein